MGVLQRGFPTVIDALSSPQVSPRWLEALGEQDRVLPFPELGSAGLILAALCQEALLCSSCFGFAQNKTGHLRVCIDPLVVAGCTTGSVCPYRCPSLKDRFPSLYQDLPIFLLTEDITLQ
jgi:hypothetical protein